MNQNRVFPVIKIHEKHTHLNESDGVNIIIVRMRDFVFKNGTPNYKLIDKILIAGGLHKYLNFYGTIIFSSIMHDDVLSQCTCETYAYLINTLKPDQYLTPDGTTYIGKVKKSRNQINKILDITEKLLKLCPKSQPIGLIKGASLSQIDFHINRLKGLGINQFCFHAGDFLYKESIYSQNLAVKFSKHIRMKVPHLMIYGIGSKSNFQKFHFADSYVTNSHFIQAFNHRTIMGVVWVRIKNKPSRLNILRNFNYIKSFLECVGGQTDLLKWIQEIPIVYMELQIPETKLENFTKIRMEA